MSKPFNTYGLAAARLREVVSYDPETGAFTRLDGGDAAGGVDKSTGYVRLRIDGHRHRANRLAWLYMTGEWPAEQVDHKNTSKADNRWTNLRQAGFAINGQNRRKANRNNKLGLLGVRRFGPKFLATIHIDGANRHLGLFETAQDAYACYVEAKRANHPGNTL